MYGQKPLRIERNRKWAKEKPKLDNGRGLRGIYFIDPDDKENVEILQNITRKLERPMAPAMPCKRAPSSITIVAAKPEIVSEKNSKRVYGCIVESHESTRQRAESSQSKIHEDRVAGKGFTSMTHKNLVHRVHPDATSDEDPKRKSRRGQGMESSRQFQHGIWKTSRAKRRLFWKHKETKRKSTLLH